MLHASLRGRQVRGLIVLAVLAAGASILPVLAAADPGDDVATAEALSRGGQHDAAARAYEHEARRLFRAPDTRLSLLAAREYLAAGRSADAERMLRQVDGRARGDDAVLLARIQAEIALARGDGTAALAALATVPEPWPAPLAGELLLLQARADFLAGRTLDGIRAFEERGRLAGAVDARAENYRLLVAELERPGVATAVPAGATTSDRGWIELAQILAAAGDGDRTTARRSADWRARHPNHPGTVLLARSDGTVATAGAAVVRPGQGEAAVALLLPLSGRQQAAGAAVRDGFFAAILGRGNAAPRVLVYDTAATGPAQAYQQALADGAGIVVGPLTREDVAALLAGEPMPLPTLALNTFAGSAPAFMYQFTLDPEQEARAAARRIAADGHTRGVALFPRGPWGERIYAAFTSEIQAAGVTLMSTAYYEAGSRDFSGPLRAVLGRYAGAGDSGDRGHAPRRDPAAEARSGPQFAFVAANAANARALVPQLRFQMVYAMPVYATSDAWDPGVRSATDMDGLEYPEFPWVLRGGEGAPLLWDVLQHEWAADARGRVRLYAFGHDAAAVAESIASGRIGTPIDGLTGRLSIGGDGRVERSLDWARIVNGRPQPPGSGIAAPPPGEP